MPPLRVLIFDVDGTLAETERGHLAAFNAAFEAAGLDWHWSLARYSELLAVTGGKERIRHYLERYRPDLSERPGLDAFIAELHARKTRLYAELVAGGGIALRPGVERLLREAREAGLRLAIATTTTPENVTALLEHTLGGGAVDWFEVIGAGGVVARKKPAPDIYHYVLDVLGLSAGACMAFEDSGPGLRAALDAGLRTLVVRNELTRDHDFSGAVLVVDGLGEPGAPCRVIAGDAEGVGYVDLPLLRRLHGAARAPGGARGGT